jgi:hypothetical protein
MQEKDTGTIGELAFSAEAMRRGYRIAQPFGDNCEYDLLLDAGQRLYRIQVKSSNCKIGAVYSFYLRRGKRKTQYTEVDIFACYLAPERLFFLIPADAVNNRSNVKLNPQPRNTQWAPYRENWGVFEQDYKGMMTA